MNLVQVDVVAQLVVDKAPGLRKDYIKCVMGAQVVPITGAARVGRVATA